MPKMQQMDIGSCNVLIFRSSCRVPKTVFQGLFQSDQREFSMLPKSSEDVLELNDTFWSDFGQIFQDLLFLVGYLLSISTLFDQLVVWAHLLFLTVTIYSNRYF